MVRGESLAFEQLLREGFSLDTKTSRRERVEIVPRTPFGCRTGEDRNVAAPVIVEILDTPLARAEAILVDRHFPMEGIDRGIDEAIPALKARHLRWERRGLHLHGHGDDGDPADLLVWAS